jgi:hypothetical protein
VLGIVLGMILIRSSDSRAHAGLPEAGGAQARA